MIFFSLLAEYQDFYSILKKFEYLYKSEMYIANHEINWIAGPAEMGYQPQYLADTLTLQGVPTQTFIFHFALAGRNMQASFSLKVILES